MFLLLNNFKKTINDKKYCLLIMDFFEEFEITQDDLSQIEELEINLLNNSFHISSDEDEIIHPVPRRRRRIMVIESEESESEERT